MSQNRRAGIDGAGIIAMNFQLLSGKDNKPRRQEKQNR